MESIEYLVDFGRKCNQSHFEPSGGESTVTQDNYSRTLQELQQSQTAGPGGHSAGGAQLTGTALSALTLLHCLHVCVCFTVISASCVAGHRGGDELCPERAQGAGETEHLEAYTHPRRGAGHTGAAERCRRRRRSI